MKQNNRMYEAVHEVVARYKRIMNIDEALDGDEVDDLCETIKEIINRNEGNTTVKDCKTCWNGTIDCKKHDKRLLA